MGEPYQLVIFVDTKENWAFTGDGMKNRWECSVEECADSSIPECQSVSSEKNGVFTGKDRYIWRLFC